MKERSKKPMSMALRRSWEYSRIPPPLEQKHILQTGRGIRIPLTHVIHALLSFDHAIVGVEEIHSDTEEIFMGHADILEMLFLSLHFSYARLVVSTTSRLIHIRRLWQNCPDLPEWQWETQSCVLA